MRVVMLTIMALLLSGCAAMMVGGANGGGYEPPKDECAGERAPDGTCKDG